MGFRWDIDSLTKKPRTEYVTTEPLNIEGKLKKLEKKANYQSSIPEVKPNNLSMPMSLDLSALTKEPSGQKADEVKTDMSAVSRSPAVDAPVEKKDEGTGIPWADLAIMAVPALLGAATGYASEGAQAGIAGEKFKLDLDKNDYNKKKDELERLLKQQELNDKRELANKKKFSPVDLIDDEGKPTIGKLQQDTGEITPSAYGSIKALAKPSTSNKTVSVKLESVPEELKGKYNKGEVETMTEAEYADFRNKGGKGDPLDFAPSIQQDPYGNIVAIPKTRVGTTGAPNVVYKSGMGEQKLPSSNESYNPPKVIREKQLQASQKFDQAAKPYKDDVLNIDKSLKSIGSGQFANKTALMGAVKEIEQRLSDRDRSYYAEPIGALENVRVKIEQAVGNDIDPKLMNEVKSILSRSKELIGKRIDDISVQSAREVGTFAGDDKAFESTLNSINPELVKRKLNEQNTPKSDAGKERVMRAVELIKNNPGAKPSAKLKEEAKKYGINI